MGLLARPNKEYWRPEEGEYKALIVDIVDLGIVENNYEGKVTYPHKFIMVTELDVREMPTKDRYTIQEWLTLSTSEMGNLRPILEDIYDRPLTDKEDEEGVDVEGLKGKRLRVKVADKVTGRGATRKVRSFIRRREPLKGKGYASNYVRSEYLEKRALAADADNALGF